jgi:hypothetical protein
MVSANGVGLVVEVGVRKLVSGSSAEPDVGTRHDRPQGPSDRVTGRRYLLQGQLVRVLARWGPGGGPRNVLVELPDGRRVVRPFRGLRRPRAV